MFSLLFVALILATLLAVSSLLGYLFKLELDTLLFLDEGFCLLWSSRH